jgi:hypothetical protein
MIREAYFYSQLSDASYAVLSDIDVSNPIVVRAALENRGFEPAQASDFVRNWRIANHQPNTSN